METFENSLKKTGRGDAITSMSGLAEAPVGSPAQYGGSRETLNPEEMFVASINSCIMLVFYYFLEKYKLEIRSYRSNAKGIVEKTKDGLRFTGVAVEAEVEIDSHSPEAKLKEIAALAEKYCLVSNSVSCPVEYSVRLRATES